MTPEQLDEIEKRWAGYLEKDEGERRFLFDRWWDKRDFWDMTKALREAWARCDTLRDLADEKAHAAGVYARRMEQAQIAGREARAEVERLKAALEEVREKNGALADRIERTDSELRDAWRAEDRLKAALRLLWEEAQDESRCQTESGYGHLISQPCREAVDAALKE